jgi:hypothetical protein
VLKKIKKKKIMWGKNRDFSQNLEECVKGNYLTIIHNRILQTLSHSYIIVAYGLIRSTSVINSIVFIT